VCDRVYLPKFCDVEARSCDCVGVRGIM
jgi:hypothetical protein